MALKLTKYKVHFVLCTLPAIKLEYHLSTASKNIVVKSIAKPLKKFPSTSGKKFLIETADSASVDGKNLSQLLRQFPFNLKAWN